MANEEDASAHVAARGMLLLASKDFVSTISSVVFFIIIGRLLPEVEDFGILVGLQTLMAMFVIILSLGLPWAATRFISTYVGSNEKSKADRLYPILFILGVFLSAIFSAVLYIFSPQLSEIMFHNVALTKLIQLAALDVFFLAICTFCISLLDASLGFKKIAWISITVSLIKYSLSFVFYIAGFGLEGIVLGLVIADVVGVIAFVFALAPRIFRIKISISSFFVELRPVFKFALPIYGYTICGFLLFRVDVYMLMILSTLYEVGLYGPAAFVSLTFFILLGSLDQALIPITSRVFGKHGTAYFKYSAVQASRFLLLFYFPLGFAIAASSPTLVVLVMGERFIESALPMFITVVATTLISPGIIANNLLRSAGYTGIALKAGAIALLGQILISLLLIPEFGTIGASGARLLAYLAFMVPLIYKLNCIGGFDYDRRAVTYGLLISGVITLEIITINTVFPGPFSLLLQYTMAFLSYLFILGWARLLNQNDVELIDRTFMGKIKWLTGPLAKLLIRES